MATSVLPQGSSHFGNTQNMYSQGLFGDYSAQSSSAPSYQLQPEEDHNSFQTPRRWSGQQNFRRPSSKSPNFRERTPIHHHRPSLSRPRSTSRPDAILAYANEQSLEQHQQQHVQQPQHTQADASNALYTPQLPPYVNPAVTSPYLHQQGVFEQSTNPHGPYSQFPSFQESHRPGDYYNLARPELQLPTVSSATLNPSDTLYSQARAPHLPSMSAMPLNFPPIPQPLESTPAEVDVVGSRQKPQCWDHGCNGRQFSTFSNLLRHQREKSGTATKARCPHCGTEFTRTTARNGHLYGGKCKGMPDGGKKSPSDTSDGK